MTNETMNETCSTPVQHITLASSCQYPRGMSPEDKSPESSNFPWVHFGTYHMSATPCTTEDGSEDI